MIAQVNVSILILSILLTGYFYVKIVGVAALEQRIGSYAYQKSTRWRITSSILMSIACVNYVIYVFHPLPLPLQITFPWSRWISVIIATGIVIPFGLLWYRGIRDAGEETIFLKKEHKMFAGIYNRIRHPQAVGELPSWWVNPFICHSPFLTLYSLIWIPIFLIMCWAEVRDLLIRYGKVYEDYLNHTPAFLPTII